MNKLAASDIVSTGLFHCFLILVFSALLGELVSVEDPLISIGAAGGMVGWMVGVGVAHLLLVAIRER